MFENVRITHFLIFFSVVTLSANYNIIINIQQIHCIVTHIVSVSLLVASAILSERLCADLFELFVYDKLKNQCILNVFSTVEFNNLQKPIAYSIKLTIVCILQLHVYFYIAHPAYTIEHNNFLCFFIYCCFFHQIIL